MSMKTPAEAVAETFDSLCRKVPLRPIRSAEQHDRAIAHLNAIIDRHPRLDESNPDDEDVVDYMDVLGLIVEDYETTLYGEGSGLKFDGDDGKGE